MGEIKATLGVIPEGFLRGSPGKFWGEIFVGLLVKIHDAIIISFLKKNPGTNCWPRNCGILGGLLEGGLCGLKKKLGGLSKVVYEYWGISQGISAETQT